MSESFATRAPDERVNWTSSLPFLLFHLAPLGALWSGVSLTSVLLCVGLYILRMFFIAGGYHRYFAHRSYKMGRGMHFIMAFGGTTAAQKGVLWWAAHHRVHHKYSDTDQDVHSPKRGLWWSHVGWILCDRNMKTRFDMIPDFAKFPELRWLNKFFLLPPTLLAGACFLIAGWSGLFIGFFLSTVILFHGTFTINSLAHVFGRRRYVTGDTSRNSFVLAMITLGEGWHNNHHHYQSATKQGFFWWEVDIAYYGLKFLSVLGLVNDLRKPSKAMLQGDRLKDGHFDIGMFGDYWDNISRSLARTRSRLGAYYEAKWKTLEEMVEAKRQMLEEMIEAKRQGLKQLVKDKREALEELIQSYRRMAEELVRLSKAPIPESI